MAMENRALRQGVIIHERYKIQKILGMGGFGITYRVFDMRENTVVALKEYMPMDIAVRKARSSMVYVASGRQAEFERFRDRFLEEARMIYRFNGHPHIVGVRHLFLENNTAYYAMDFMEGSDLGVLLRGKRLSWGEIVPIMDQVVFALDTMHQNGMIHRDISPDNVFIQKNGQAKLIDFGAVKMMMRGPSTVLIKKNGFSPPEQINSNPKIGPWTDVYALAATIYMAFTGKRPEDVETRAMYPEEMLWPSQMGIAVPSPEWEEVLQKGMAMRYQERYQDVMTFWRILKAAGSQVRNQEPVSEWFPVLEGIRGRFTGSKIFVNGPVCFGTDQKNGGVVYPVGSPGIGGFHMRVWVEDGILYAVDAGSRAGSFLNGVRMTPGLVYRLDVGMYLAMGAKEVFLVSPLERS